jgi:hypothetical protein
MKTMNTVLAIVVLVMTAAQCADPQVVVSKPWTPATYHGLVMGKSTRADVIKVLGNPKWAGREQDTGIPIMSYEVSDPVPGTLVVYVEKEILDGMTLNPKNRLTKSDLLRLLGHDYIIVRYDTDDCLAEGGTAPIYETPNGPIKHMEYRDRGVAVIFYQDNVEAILFTFKPFGPTHSLCAGRAKKD